MNAQRFANEIRRKNPTVTHFVVVVEEGDGRKILSVKNEAGDVLGRGYESDDLTWEHLNDWARAVVAYLQVTAELFNGKLIVP